jgi:hypothetical protein
VSSMQGRAGAAAESPRPPPESFLDPFTKLTSLLGPVEDEPQQLDASQESAHKLVAAIWHALFDEGGVLKPSEEQNLYNGLKTAREEENDWHERYTYALDLLRRPPEKNLSRAEAIRDKGALVEERRAYIGKLHSFHEQASAIDVYLRERPSQS